ncbi:MAG TPA: DUF6152 family protein [Terriglobia bacterium]|nr:DUF6152 family protein [Terriglobia bacterium]
MKARYLFASLIVVGIQLSEVSLRAHHATGVQFDISKTVKLQGVVSKLNWANPHAHVLIDVKRDRGTEEHWDVELASPGGIIVSGLSQDLLKPGTTVTVTGYPAKANASVDSSSDPASPSASQLSLCAIQLMLADGTTANFVVGI